MHMNKKFIIPVVIVAILLAAGAGYWLYKFNSGEDVIIGESTEFQYPVSLLQNKVDVYMVNEQGVRTLQTISGNNMNSKFPLVKGSVMDYDKAGKTEAMIVSEDGRFNILVKTEVSDWTEVVSTAPVKQGLSVDPTGRYVAFSEFTDTSIDSLLPAAWTLYVFDVAEGELGAMSQGFAPQFTVLDEAGLHLGLVMSSPNGLALIDPAAKTLQTSDFATSKTSNPALVTPNGDMVLLFNEVTARYDVFKATWGSPFSLAPLHSIPATNIAGVTNEFAYSISGTDIIEYPLGFDSNGVTLQKFGSAALPVDLEVVN